MDQQRLVPLLEAVLAPNTDSVKAATAELKRDYYSKPESLPLLIQVLTSPSDQLTPQVRQLAATQARTLVPKHWSAVPANLKPQIRNHLLEATLREQSSPVRHAAARVISSIAKVDVEDGEWADLPSLMQHAARSASVQQREVSTYILFAILENLGDGFLHRFGDLFALFSQTIHDPESMEVRMNTMMALSKMAMFIDTDGEDDSSAAALEQLQATIPSMVTLLKEAIDASDESRTLQAFEVFHTLLTCDSKLLNKHFRELVQFMANVGANEEADDDSRTQAISFLMQTVNFRKLKFQSLRIGEELTRGILEIIAKDADSLEGDDDDLTPASSALGLLGIMAENLPPNQTVVPILSCFKEFATSPDPSRRETIIRAIGACVEGAPDFVDTQLQSFLPGVLRLLEDPEIRVREAALSGVGSLADCLAENLGKEHAKLMPALARNLAAAMQGLNDSDAKRNLGLVTASCEAIESLVDGMDDDDIRGYVPELVPHLSGLYEHPDYKVKAAAIGAVGAMAMSAKEDFMPFFEQTMHSLSRYIELKDSEDDLDLRCVACDTIGNVALAVGAKPFKQFVPPMMRATEEGLHLGHPRLRETSFLFWSDMGKVYESEFKSFLPGVVQALHACLEQEESSVEVELGTDAADLVGKEVVIGGKKVKVAAAEDDDVGEDEMDGMNGDDSDEDWEDDVQAITALAMEKEVAIEVLANLVAFTHGAFTPYLEKSIEIILPMVEHSYEGLRKAAISALFRIYAVLWEMQDESQSDWQPGLPLKIQPSGPVAKLGEVIITAALAVWETDDDRSTISEVNANVASTLRLCGPAIISGSPKNIEVIITNLRTIIARQHPCQQDLGEDDDDPSELAESSEYDWQVIDTALEVLMGLAKALGPQFSEIWPMFEKSVMQFASSSTSTERCTAVGTIADCVRGMGNAVTPFTSQILKALLHRLGDEDVETKANAAFAMGVLIESTQKDAEVLKAYNSILAKLEPLLREESSRMLDNAAGCVSRMIIKHRDRVPLDEVLPALVEILPLKEDFEENEPVWGMIVQLFSAGVPAMTNLAPQLIPVVAQVMSPPTEQLSDETREQLTLLVKFVYGKKPDMVQPYAKLVEVANS